jgi:hypothetical protein
MVFCLGLAIQIAIDHLTNRRRSICHLLQHLPRPYNVPSCPMSDLMGARTRKPHVPHFHAIFLQRFGKHLALRRLSGSIQTFEYYELSASHGLYVELEERWIGVRCG